MRKNILVLLSVLAFAFIGMTVSAQTVEPTPRFGQQVKELRKENRQERETLREENQEDREEFRNQRKTDFENVKEENQASREATKDEIQKLLEGKTPEEKLTLMPTINAMRKATNEANTANRKTAVQNELLKRKDLFTTIQTRMDTFRQSVRTKFANLWNSFFGKK